MAAGVTADGTEVMIYDNADASAGGDGSYSFADIFAVLGGTGVDILRVDSGTGLPTYRMLKNLQIGDKTTNAAATTLQDKNVAVTFDAGKVLKTRATQTSSWSCIFGTKIGSGTRGTGKDSVGLFFTNTAGGNTVILRGAVKWYATNVQSTASGGTQALQFAGLVAGVCEFMNCSFYGFTTYAFGTSLASFANFYNVDISGNSTSTGNITSFFVDTAERNTIGGDPTSSHISSGASGLTIKDQAFFGTPGQSDLRWTTPSATNWSIVRPLWSGVSKFAGPGPSSVSSGAQEYWAWSVKAVDRNGVGVSGIPVSLVDSTGATQVSTTTDANGETNYGSGITANFSVTMDHYADSFSNYLQRHRSPFTVYVNTGASRNPNYLSKTFMFYWPGYSSVTTTAGTFEDVADIVPIEDPSGGPTTWVECSIP